MDEKTIDQEVKEIESLLDEVETNYFLTSYKRYDPNKLVEETNKCECTKKTATNWAEVDALLKEFKFQDSNPYLKSKNKPWNRDSVQKYQDEGFPSSEPKNKYEFKCFPIYLAGSAESVGLSQAGSEKPCARLKCLKCDFDVAFFDNYSWDSSVDYLFLRNNMPEFAKVAQKLRKHRGYRAYACQCQCLSIEKITNVKAVPQVRWICGKH